MHGRRPRAHLGGSGGSCIHREAGQAHPVGQLERRAHEEDEEKDGDDDVLASSVRWRSVHEQAVVGLQHTQRGVGLQSQQCDEPSSTLEAGCRPAGRRATEGRRRRGAAAARRSAHIHVERAGPPPQPHVVQARQQEKHGQGEEDVLHRMGGGAGRWRRRQAGAEVQCSAVRGKPRAGRAGRLKDGVQGESPYPKELENRHLQQSGEGRSHA